MGRGPPSSEVGEQYVENLFSAEKNLTDEGRHRQVQKQLWLQLLGKP